MQRNMYVLGYYDEFSQLFLKIATACITNT